MKSQTYINQNLIVLTGFTFPYITWGLSHAIRLSRSGENVLILDSSRYQVQRLSTIGLFFPLYYRLRYRNGLFKVISRLKSLFALRIIKLKSSKTIVSLETSNSNLVTAYVNAIDAMFAETLGFRVTKLDQIPHDIHFKYSQVFLEITSSFQSFIKGHIFKHVYLTNDRTITGSAIKGVLLEESIPFSIIEGTIGANLNYEIYPPSFREDLPVSQHIANLWANRHQISNLDSILETAASKKISGIHFGGERWWSDISIQDAVKELSPNLRSALLNSKVPKIAFFPTTDLEIPSNVDSNGEALPSDQQNRFQELKSCALSLGYQIIIRAHPYPGDPIRQKYESELWKVYEDRQYVHLIPSDNPFPSKQLLLTSDLNAVYASSIFIDSVLLNRPTLLLGKFELVDLAPEVYAESVFEINEFLKNPELLIVEESRVQPWLLYSEIGGYNPILCGVNKDNHVTFEGKPFEVDRLDFAKKYL
jgi:hypothetical protein